MPTVCPSAVPRRGGSMQGTARSAPQPRMGSALTSFKVGKIAASATLALLFAGGGGLAASDSLFSANGSLILVGAAALTMVLPAIAVFLRVRARDVRAVAP